MRNVLEEILEFLFTHEMGSLGLESSITLGRRRIKGYACYLEEDRLLEFFRTTDKNSGLNTLIEHVVDRVFSSIQ